MRETEAGTPGGKSLHLQGSSGSKSSQEQGTSHILGPKGKIHGTAYKRIRAQKIEHSEPQKTTKLKSLGESHDQAHHNPQQGQKGKNKDETKKQQKEGRGSREEERQKPGIKGLEKTKEGAVKNKNPWTSFNLEKRAWIGHRRRPHR